MKRRDFAAGLGSAAVLAGAPLRAKAAPKVLRVAMTAADIPLTTGQPSQGSEGIRFMGVTAYDGLVNWDLSRSDVKAGIRPGLAESWSTDPAVRTVWTFKLRKGVTFHDGSDFTAESVVWNLDKLLRQGSPQFDTAQSAQAGTFVNTIATYAAADSATLKITTHEPDANLPYKLASFFISSPARWKELGGDWRRVALHPSGTGPWKVDTVVPRERVVFSRNEKYWESARIPKCDGMVILPMPDAVTRANALLTGQVDWVEAPDPDMTAKLKQAGMQVITNIYPHIWPYLLSCLPDSPFRDLRVRKAMNLAIDRDGIVSMLGGTAMAARGMVPPNDPWFGKPTFDIRYDPAEAKKLMQQAGYGPGKPCDATFLISTAGSGQMQPLPMNEAIKEGLSEVGFNVTLDVMEWETLRGRRRSGAKAAENKGKHALNNSLGSADPTALIDASWFRRVPPSGFNWGWFQDPKVDALAAAAEVEFELEKQNKILADLHAAMVDNAEWAYVVHDLNPRALAPNVKGFVQAQSWFQDLTPVYLT